MAEATIEVALRTIVTVRPGDTLVVATGLLSMDRMMRMKERLEAELPGVKAVFVEANGLAVYQPEPEFTPDRSTLAGRAPE